MLGWHDERALSSVLPDKEAKALKKAFGYTTCDELLQHVPRKYVRHGLGLDLDGANEGDIVTIVSTVTSTNTRHTTARGGRNLEIFNVHLDNGVSVSFFNTPWARRSLFAGVRAMFSGKVKFFRGNVQLQHPDFFVLGAQGGATTPTPDKATGSLRALASFGELEDILYDRDWLPIYPATKQVTSWRLLGAVHRVLETLPPVPDPLDPLVTEDDLELPRIPVERDGLPQPLLSLDAAVRGTHEPGPEGPQAALTRLKFNEALAVATVMELRRADAAARVATPLVPRRDGFRAAMLATIPFELTAGQQQVVEEIGGDLEDSSPMSRLLQGEVGSGKTIVAALAMLQAVDAGAQAALLAPTEVLAAQHATSLRSSLPAGVNVVLLTGSMKTAEKRQALLDIVSGEANIVVGTHSLIQDSVEFFNLGLVVVDEQHRFGVEQRDRLRDKALGELTPHLLVMTATPIPRTIAMTVFGDLAVSTLRELPGGRKPIQSSVVPDERENWVQRAWARIREEVAAGHQAFVVCPRIEGDGGVEEIAADLATGPLKGLRIGVLHGRMPNKDAVMTDFAAGDYDVLVATTVIEVGVDVPNATVMLIREAESFGVSQLHQLRGRVGRGRNASLCLFHTLAPVGSTSFNRIRDIAATSDGFELAELDLQDRQEGDVLGTAQSGTHRTLRLLNLRSDAAIIEAAHGVAAQLVAVNPDAATQLVSDLTATEQEYLDKS